MARCSLCSAEVIYARTAASSGKKSMPVNAEPDVRGQCWFEKMTDHKGREANLLVVASGDHPRPAHGRFFRQHNIDCSVYKTKKRIERLLAQGRGNDGD